jgi:glycosyltransferase involved in cell wall biosynthesis
MHIAVIIPVLNEEHSISKVLEALPRAYIDVCIVVDNGSTDQTPFIAQSHGAIVLSEPKKGYGNACLKGIEYANKNDATCIVFLDGDYSDYPEELIDLLAPIIKDEADFVVGSRVTGTRSKGALPIVSLLGNTFACWYMRVIFGFQFTDLGPFRAITMKALRELNMEDKTYGWTIEMQIKALRNNLRIQEVPVRYRKRIGKSKVSGTVKGVFLASVKILFSLLKYTIKKF